jgi:hypothetical protein
MGFTSRCEHCVLFGSPNLAGAQAQFLRVPKAGGTLHRLSDLSPREGGVAVETPAFLVLGDIVPTGYFAAFQAISHPNVQLRLRDRLPFPFTTGIGKLPGDRDTPIPPHHDDSVLSIAVVGLGPVGVVS